MARESYITINTSKGKGVEFRIINGTSFSTGWSDVTYFDVTKKEDIEKIVYALQSKLEEM